MKIIVLVPSQEYKNNAGARIRYRRLWPAENSRFHILLEDIGEFDPRTAACDVLLISKCHDARALLAATIMGQRGIRVGVDLFDDYFSQSTDSRLNRFRGWLSQLLPLCDFVMSSTALMADVVRRYHKTIPIHVLNDPAPPRDQAVLAQLLREKLSDARVEGRLRLAWFGVGDNPYFPLGLSDLAAYSDLLAELDRLVPVELSILTNARSLDADRLGMIANLPVRTTVNEWSEVAENELLAQSTACFLPVNAQPFSTAKSLNRAVTALSAGCQVISAGYPLYRPLDAFLYREVDDFVADLRSGTFRLSETTLEAFEAALEKLASAEREAEELASFLERFATPRTTAASGPLLLVHGYATNGAAHKLAQSAGGLSVASPFSSARMDYDVVFQARPGKDLVMLVSDKALTQMRPEPRGRLVSFGTIGKRNFWEVRGEHAASSGHGAWQDPSLSLQLALYPSVMKRVIDDLAETFGTGSVIISENSVLPFEAVV